MNSIAIAEAFGLGKPVGPLELVQASDFDTWQLRTNSGRYLVKRLWQGDEPSWSHEHRLSMQLERRAIDAGIRTPMPILPIEPAFGYAASVEDFGMMRIYEWVEHRALTAADNITDWFGRTLSTLHQLMPLDREFVPEWRWLGVYPRERWETWIDAAAGRDKPWVAIARQRLDDLITFTERVQRAYGDATDLIISHRDLGPWNVLVADEYVLIDWEGAGPVIASCETGRAIDVFSRDNTQTMYQLRDSYLAAGGTITCAPEDFMLNSLADLLGQITERIRIMIDDYPDPDIPAWMDPPTADQKITADLERFPEVVQRLSNLGTRLLS